MLLLIQYGCSCIYYVQESNIQPTTIPQQSILIIAYCYFGLLGLSLVGFSSHNVFDCEPSLTFYSVLVFHLILFQESIHITSSDLSTMYIQKSNAKQYSEYPKY